MRGEFKSQDEVFEQASVWYYRLRDPDVMPETITQWQTWLYEKPEHIDAFTQVEELMHISGKVDHLDWPDDAELLEDDYDGEQSIAQWRQNQKIATETASSTSWRKWLSLSTFQHAIPSMGAACLVLSFLAIFWVQTYPRDKGNIFVSVHETSAGQHDSIQLEDGSKITLGAKSLLSVAYSKKQRKVVLERGEAYFDVAKDPQRPFIVGSGTRTITAVGTEFNVIKQSERVVVTVTEGKVKVAPIVAFGTKTAPRIAKPLSRENEDTFLIAGQQISYNQQSVRIVDESSTEVATAWREGNLQYLTEKLRFVVEDINRYSEIPIRLGDDKVGELAYSGTVFTDRVDSWLESLPVAFPVKILRNSNGAVVIAADPTRI
ncbi:FecR domain-containing protein [Aliiglaciecola sp. 2_MG-2023]|uniref:FecR family protein n=1 Tax=unclassified Aliiglaciecola TaxID=2593648 RepID=UPI0026E1A2FC|nr:MULTISPECIES: FecR domain-containing protein [unclassified Aliiglaciecola]MDO6712145.1 FecR domain-containing protein [Aliiglaciecola sp. 2_MG-2023]MDO6753225.1 FecR domain-containing protein [Aliiglaciecola sp. 1_MG-2023]